MNVDRLESTTLVISCNWNYRRNYTPTLLVTAFIVLTINCYSSSKVVEGWLSSSSGVSVFMHVLRASGRIDQPKHTTNNDQPSTPATNTTTTLTLQTPHHRP